MHVPHRAFAALSLVLMASACSSVVPTVAPAAVDRPQLWAWVDNRSSEAAHVAFTGVTGGAESSASVDVPACYRGAWNFPIEEAWALAVMGEVVADAAEPVPPTTDLVAAITISDAGVVSLQSLGPAPRPPGAGKVC